MTGTEQFDRESEIFLCMPVELYHVDGTSLYIIQQRSPIVPSYTRTFSNEFYNLMNTLQYKVMIILCGGSMEGLPDSYLYSKRTFFIPPTTLDSNNIREDRNKLNNEMILLASTFSNLQSNLSDYLIITYPLNNKNNQNVEDHSDNNEVKINSKNDLNDINMKLDMLCINKSNHHNIQENNIILPLGMNMIKYYLDINKHKNVYVLGRLCDEGDNTVDGIELASLLALDLELISAQHIKQNMCYPLSWNKLFGPPASSDSDYFY